MRMFYRSRWCSFPFKAEVNSKCFLWISPAVLVTLAAPIYDVSIMGSVTFSWITWIFSWITQIQNTAQRIKYQEQYTCPSLSNSFILNFRASLQTLSDILHRKKKGAAFTSKKKNNENCRENYRLDHNNQWVRPCTREPKSPYSTICQKVGVMEGSSDGGSSSEDVIEPLACSKYTCKSSH